MSKDPAFLFYPGDYLRDTQTLSSNSQVAYDRIICEHMRNICISQKQLKFFTKRLSEDELEELMFVLIKVRGGYQIEWVAESIEKRRKYSKSRSENRKGKGKNQDNISTTYDTHMEDEIENEIVTISKDKIILPFDSIEFLKSWEIWKDYKKNEHKFNYKSNQSEQAAAIKLSQLSGGDEKIAIKIINESLANGWKGFFKLTNQITDSQKKANSEGFLDYSKQKPHKNPFLDLAKK